MILNLRSAAVNGDTEPASDITLDSELVVVQNPPREPFLALE